jgi:HAD superfamily hydrolase (TIGR01509 family)
VRRSVDANDFEAGSHERHQHTPAAARDFQYPPTLASSQVQVQRQIILEPKYVVQPSELSVIPGLIGSQKCARTRYSVTRHAFKRTYLRVRFDAMVFDMDGVLLDSEPLHFKALATVLGAEGVELAMPEFEEFIGTTTESMFLELVARHALARPVSDYIARYDTEILRLLRDPRPPAPGVLELLSAARSTGLRLALASSSRRVWIDATLRSIGLAYAFDAIASGDQVTHSKPHPEIYLLAAERLAVAAERCLAIEDSPNGVQSARRAGMSVIGVRTPYTAHLHLDGVLYTVDSLTEVNLLQTLQ